MEKKSKKNAYRKALLSSVAAMAVAVNVAGTPLASIPQLYPQSIIAYAEDQVNDYSVSVIGGKLSDGSTSGSYQASKLVTVKSEAPESGKKFSH